MIAIRHPDSSLAVFAPQRKLPGAGDSAIPAPSPSVTRQPVIQNRDKVGSRLMRPGGRASLTGVPIHHPTVLAGYWRYQYQSSQQTILQMPRTRIQFFSE